MTKPRRYLENRGREEISAKAKAANKREAEIAKQYFNAGPSIGNIVRGAYHWYNSVPMLGGQNESGLELQTGFSPDISIKNYTTLINYLNKAKSLQKAVNTDKFVTFLSNRTGKSIKRIPIKETKIGDIYSDGYSYVDATGKEESIGKIMLQIHK